MSDVTYTPLLDGIVLSADTIYPYFIRLNGVDSMSVINGYLDTANLSVEDMTGVNYNLIQRGAQSTAGSVAGTRNLDFFGGTSNTIQGVYDGVGNVEVAPGRRWIPIPGASIQFRLDYPSYILLTWHIGWASNPVFGADTRGSRASLRAGTRLACVSVRTKMSNKHVSERAQ